jgi:hypothetical protein
MDELWHTHLTIHVVSTREFRLLILYGGWWEALRRMGISFGVYVRMRRDHVDNMDPESSEPS